MIFPERESIIGLIMKESSSTQMPEPETTQNEIEMPKGYISLRHGSHQGRLTLIRCDVNLPPYLGEFGLNAKAITNLGRLAGFRTIRIVSSSKDSSETTFALQGGVGGDGTLKGSLSAATTLIPEANSDLLYDDDVDVSAHIPRGRVWSDLTITLNTKEIQERMRNDGKAVNDKKTWAQHINNSIAEEILKKGTFNLLRSGDPRNDLSAFLQGPVTALFQRILLDGDLIIRPRIDLKSYIELAIVDLIMYSYIFRLNDRRGNGPGRFSLLGVHAPALDRAIALLGLAKSKIVNPMVKPIQAK